MRYIFSKLKPLVNVFVFTEKAIFFVLVLALATLCLNSSAQNLQIGGSFPSKPIQFVVPFPPGSATDMAARVISQPLSVLLGQPIVVENKPGASGSIGAMEVIRAAPDGYTLLFASNSAVASNVALLKKIPYDPNKDFTPVVGIGETALVLMVKANSPYKNLADLVSSAKQRPGKVSAGFGSSSSQICIGTLNKLAGLDVLPIPYKGIPLAVNDVVGGTLDFTFADIGNAQAQAKGGTMRALAISSAKRSPLAPDWPSASETLPAFDISAWFAVVGPSGVPREVVEKLSQAMIQILKRNETREKLASIGLTPMPTPPDQLQSFISSEIIKWKRIAKDANIEPE